MEKTDINKNQEKRREIVLPEFRRRVKDILEPHHDDQFLMKWLIARDFDLIKAEKMIRESFLTRKKFGVNTVLSDYVLPEVYKRYRVSEFLGFDKENEAVRLFLVGIWDCKGNIQAYSFVDFIRIFGYFLEQDIKRMEDKKKEGLETNMKITFIVDFTDFSLKRFYDKQVIKRVIQLLNMLQDNYPEILKTVYFVNVPSYFSFLYNLFKPFASSSTLSKVKIFNTDEYQEELRNLLDPKLIPAYLGGELTGPDGDPKCTHILDWNPKVDPSFYLANNTEEPDPSMTTATVQKRAVLKVPIEVHTCPAILRWAFSSKEYNIRFGLFFRREGKSSRLEEIIPVDNVDCHMLKEENEFICKKTGTYILHFDNSYSWLTAKEISYKVELEKLDPNDIIN